MDAVVSNRRLSVLLFLPGLLHGFIILPRIIHFNVINNDFIENGFTIREVEAIPASEGFQFTIEIATKDVTITCDTFGDPKSLTVKELICDSFSQHGRPVVVCYNYCVQNWDAN